MINTAAPKHHLEHFGSILPILKERWSAMPEEAQAKVKADMSIEEECTRTLKEIRDCFRAVFPKPEGKFVPTPSRLL